MTSLILSILLLAGIFALSWGIRACGRELKGLDEDSKRDVDMTKEIETWRRGK